MARFIAMMQMASSMHVTKQVSVMVSQTLDGLIVIGLI